MKRSRKTYLSEELTGADSVIVPDSELQRSPLQVSLFDRVVEGLVPRWVNTICECFRPSFTFFTENHQICHYHLLLVDLTKRLWNLGLKNMKFILSYLVESINVGLLHKDVFKKKVTNYCVMSRDGPSRIQKPSGTLLYGAVTHATPVLLTRIGTWAIPYLWRWEGRGMVEPKPHKKWQTTVTEWASYSFFFKLFDLN